MNRAILSLAARMPSSLDVIVGVPRSGLMAGILLALYLNKAVTDVEGLLVGRLLSSGKRCKALTDGYLAKPRNILIIDDSICSGEQLLRVQSMLRRIQVPHTFLYCAVFVTPNAVEKVDYYGEVVESPRIFEWNLMHHPLLEDSCVDIDGVLCVDPTDAENDDGERYRCFLANAVPLVVPTVCIGWLVTSRLEKYRELTQKWLAQHGVRYRHLVMLDLPDKQARLQAACHASFKTGVYKRTDSELFIESNAQQAYEIAKGAGKPVFCVESRRLIQPDVIARFAYGVPRSMRKFWRTLPLSDVIRRMAKRLTNR
jgi:orotate phosphoribosyltransferase